MQFNIFKNFPYRIYIRNMEHKVVYANEIACEFLSLKEEDIIDKTYEEVFKDENFINHFLKIDKELFLKDIKSIISIQEYNRCYKKETIFKLIEYLYIYEKEKFVVAFMIEINDTYNFEDKPNLTIGTYNPKNRTVIENSGKIIQLTRLENSFFFILFEKKGEMVGYDELFLILDNDNTMTKGSLKALIYRLKKKFERNIIENVPKDGYKINDFLNT